ncbi:MAG: type II toxin-antitoxin system VapC family toxin [Thiobacillus sp.]|nr:type II toxin-antitoxin system VapC family toxin [Thiobacillus sp.]
MRVTEVYLDTSALIKLYVAEAFSNEVERLVAEADGLVISRLSMLEWHCAMARRLRTGQITQDYLNIARTEFTRHLADGYFRIVSFDDTLLIDALRVLDSVNPVPLRTLDAIHLTAARNAGVARLATGDRVMADAANKLNLATDTFFV